MITGNEETLFTLNSKEDYCSIVCHEKVWVCGKGHEFKGNYPAEMVANNGLEYEERYTFCPVCYMEWFKDNIPSMKEK